VNAPAASERSLQAGGDIDAVAKDVVALDNDVTDVDADGEGNTPVLSYASGSIRHRCLDLDCATPSIDYAWKFRQQAVAGGLDDATAVAGNRGVHDVLTKALHPRQRAAFVSAHQAGVADNVCSNDCRQFALLTRQRHSPE
jgi:hypothetical protein